MNRKQPKEDVISSRYWFFALFLAAIPLVNLIAIPGMAFFGKSQSKKNFFRAIILWFALLVGINLVVILVVGGQAYFDVYKNYKEPTIEEAIQRGIDPDEQ